jgi:hypothetical protein
VSRGSPPAVSQTADRSATPSASRAFVAESPDHRFLAIGLVSGDVIVLDSMSGAQLAVVKGQGTPLERLAFDTQGQLTIRWTSGRVDLIGLIGVSDTV